ncbi:hypothetical protein SLA2020_373500 [Shorea laevis]
MIRSILHRERSLDHAGSFNCRWCRKVVIHHQEAQTPERKKEIFIDSCSPILFFFNGEKGIINTEGPANNEPNVLQLGRG